MKGKSRLVFKKIQCPMDLALSKRPLRQRSDERKPRKLWEIFKKKRCKISTKSSLKQESSTQIRTNRKLFKQILA